MSHSRTITNKSASNLALAFCTLPKEKRQAMCVLYAFCREVDDIADNESIPVEKRRAMLAEWKDDLLLCFNSGNPNLSVNKEIKELLPKYNLKFELFEELIKGVEMDLSIKRYNTFEELELYCYRVASVVGLLSIEIFGCNTESTKNYAIYLGKALQLTNILRDVKNDAERGRIYLPLQEMKKIAVSEDEILNGVYSPRFYDLAEIVYHRAVNFYSLARANLPEDIKKNMIAAELMAEIYWRLLMKLKKLKFNVFDRNIVKLSKLEKLFLVLMAIVSAKTNKEFKTTYGLIK